MRLPQLRAVEILHLLERIGYQRVGPPGGHVKMRKLIEGKEHNITIPMHKGRDLPRWLMAKLLKQVAEANGMAVQDLVGMR